MGMCTMRMSEDRREWFHQRLIGLKDVIKTSKDKREHEVIKGEIQYLETMLRADEFCTYSDYPIF